MNIAGLICKVFKLKVIDKIYKEEKPYVRRQILA